MNSQRTYGLVASIAGTVCCLAVTAQAGMKVKPPAGPPTPPVTPGMYIINATATSDDAASRSYIDADGKFLICGQSNEGTDGYSQALVRLTAAGTFDSDFGKGGIATQPILYNARANACVTKSDGRLVGVGMAYKLFGENEFALAGYNADGSKDKNFGRRGITTTDFYGHDDEATDAAVQSDDSIVAVGGARFDYNSLDFITARYTADGQLDSSFGGDGEVLTVFALATHARAAAVEIDPLGEGIVVCGYAQIDEMPHGALVRLDNDGLLDTDFGDDGRAVAYSNGGSSFPGYINSDFADLAIDIDGTIVVAGEVYGPTKGLHVLVARFRADGTLDSTFGSPEDPETGDRPGFATLALPTGAARARAVAIQDDGKIVAAGETFVEVAQDVYQEHLLVARFNSDGEVDTTFGDGDGHGNGAGQGWSIRIIGERFFTGSVIIQRDVLPGDFRILVSGSTFNYDAGRRSIAIVRFAEDGSLDLDFNPQ